MVPAPTAAGPGFCTRLAILGTVAFPSGPPGFPHLCLSPPCPGRPLALLLPSSEALCWGFESPSLLPPSPFLKLSSTLLPPVLFPMPFLFSICAGSFPLSLFYN